MIESVSQAIILGLIQGIAEWLPVSSEGMIVLYLNNTSNLVFSEMISTAVWLHLGTLFSVCVFFWSDVKQLFNRLISSASQQKFVNHEIRFYTITSLASIVVATALYLIVKQHETLFTQYSNVINYIIAFALIITGVLQIIKKSSDSQEKTGNLPDMIYTGIGQALAVIPGISRSGTTTAILLLRSFSETQALKISFLLSIPIILAGNIGLGIVSGFSITIYSIVAAIVAFISGLITIKTLLSIARRVNFGWFVICFAVVIILSSLFL